MDINDIAHKLGLSDNKPLVRKAAEIRRLCDVKFDSSVIGVGEICKAVICLEIASNRFNVIFDRQAAIKVSGMPEKAYNRSFNSLQNILDIKNKLDIRELGIQFGCVRLIPIVQRGLKTFKDRFIAALPPARRASTDFTRPVFTAVAFYLCAKKQKLKVDKMKLIEICGTSESEFTSVATSMLELCFDIFGVSKEKKDAKEIKGHRELLDVLPEKRSYDDGYLSDGQTEPSCYKKRKQMEKRDYDEWKSSVIASNKDTEKDGIKKPKKQLQLDLTKMIGSGTEKDEMDMEGEGSTTAHVSTKENSLGTDAGIIDSANLATKEDPGNNCTAEGLSNSKRMLNYVFASFVRCT